MTLLPATKSGASSTQPSPAVLKTPLVALDEQTRAPSTAAQLPPPPPPSTTPTPAPLKQDEVRVDTKLNGEPSAGTVPERCELEGFTPFAQCHLWKLMMSFYDREGVESWAQGIVPHFITSNTFIAKRYSNVLRAYFRDATRANTENPLDPTELFYIIELGTGSGKFSFYFLKALAEVENALDFPLDKIRYIMTDFTEQNFNFWKTHPALAPFVARGIVDFALFDATKDTELRLFCAQTTVSATAPLANPLCVIANYLFDTLHHDLFQVDRGELKQGLISVGSKRAHEPDPLDPEIIKRLANLFQYVPIPPDFYGPAQPHLNNILQWYRTYFSGSSSSATSPSSSATVLVPIGALSALERLSALSSSRLVVLSGDKGNSNPEHFRGVSDPHIAVHGSFSVMVNYHAIGLYFASRGGFALHSAQEDASLKVSLFVLPGSSATNASDASLLRGDGLDRVCDARSRAFPHLTVAFDDEIASFGPNDFFVLQKAMKEDAKAPTLKAVLALLKLSWWDPDMFYKFRDVLLDHAPASPLKLQRDVCDGIPRVWRNYYALDKEKDIAFEVGRLYYGLRDYDRALAFYTLSAREMGAHHVTSHNMGLCHYSKRQLALAAACFEEAYALNSSYQKAATWLQRVRRELAAADGTGDDASSGVQSPAVDAEQESRALLVQQIELVLQDHEEETARVPTRLPLGSENTTSLRRKLESESENDCGAVSAELGVVAAIGGVTDPPVSL